MPPGCLAILIFVGLLLFIPFFYAQAMFAAVSRLGLSPDLAVLAIVGIFFGSVINIPITRIEREQEVTYDPFQIFGLGRMLPQQSGWNMPGQFRRTVHTYTVIAVNVGGALIPVLIALYEIVRVLNVGSQVTFFMTGITALNILVCYRLAQPVANVGIAMPALIPPLVAAIPAILLVPDFAPPVAFVAGVLGPLIGADLFHLRDISRIATGMASIGGAGTFDGIVLSGIFAALLA